MPYLETPDELADALADMLGIYGACDSEICDCKKDGKTCCRVGFLFYMAQRIRDSVINEKLVNGADN